ncbi:serine/threonine-protein kinase [Rubritalea tangerina]|uniref:Serine/threonine-protein kinase n=2 Tax=Rubritalea tangerina TaxID=430798 RepID=A0ABW4ZDD3_9BACT
MDVTTLPPYTNVQCPNCGEHSHVKCEIGNYEVYKRQGIGGMSLVFAARDKTLGRKVAIKLLNEDYSRDEKRIAEFEKEAKITAAISHPNVVRVYTVGQAFKRYYIAMELVEGKSLEQLMQREGKLSEEMITRLAIEIVDGLKAAHQEGLIHRDMKPGNVLIDAKGHAKIVDFGLALMTSGGKAIADEIWATPYYVPPETLELKEEDLRSDIYALGASLYHALSGEPPFTTETRSTTELLKIKTDVPRLGKVTSDVSPFLCEVIDKAMAFEPEDRFQSYEEFLAALRQVELFFRTGNEPEALSEPTKTRRMQRKRSHVGLIAGIGGIAAVGVIGAIIASQKEEAVTPDTVVEDSTGTDVEAPVNDDEARRVLIAAELRNAQHLLDQKKYLEAHRKYLRLAQGEGMESETVYWAGTRSAIAAWLAGDAEGARVALRQILRKQEKSGGAKSSVDKKLQVAMSRLLDLKPITIESTTSSQDDLDIMILFASALKEWEQGHWQNAEILFDTLKLAKTEGDQRSLERFKGLADDYLSDYRLLASYRKGLEPGDVAEAKKLQLEILAARDKLKTRGRARFNTIEWQRQLNSSIATMQKSSELSKQREREQRDSAVRKWREAKKSALGSLERHEFGRARKALESVEALSESDKAWRESTLYLTQSVVNLYRATFEALDGKSAEFEVRRLDGMEEYSKILGVEEKGLKVEGKRGREVLLPWRELSPYTMLELHKKIPTSHLDEKQKAERREQLVAYCWLSGLDVKAKSGAASLAEDSPEFAARWKKCMEAVD